MIVSHDFLNYEKYFNSRMYYSTPLIWIALISDITCCFYSEAILLLALMAISWTDRSNGLLLESMAGGGKHPLGVFH